LSLLGAPERVRIAGALLDHERWGALLEEALAEFSHVVVDTAPLDSFSDTLTVAPHAEAVCLVVRAGRTPRAAAERVTNLLSLAKAKLAGVVLNGQAKSQGHNS
jgi:Mrp family chromosome partitioning ATPase